MKIRVLHGFSVYEAGQVFDDWPDGMCEQLIARGLIEPASPVLERADQEQEVERAEASPKHGKKPRK